MSTLFFAGDKGRFSSGFDISVFEEIHRTGNFEIISLCHFVLENKTEFGLFFVWAGNISLLPNVSADLVVNRIEGLDTILNIQGSVN